MLTVIAKSKKLSIRWKRYGVAMQIYLGRKQRCDIDNLAKVPLDALVAAGVIDSDAKVTTLHLYKHRDIDNPRTVISVWAE